MLKTGYALIDVTNGTVAARFNDTLLDGNGRPQMYFIIPGTSIAVHAPEVGGLYGDNARFKFVERFSADVPTYNADTQALVGPNETLTEAGLVLGYTVRDLSASEIDAEKDRKVGLIERLTFEVLFDHENRIRALEAKAPITRTQFRTALKNRLGQISGQ